MSINLIETVQQHLGYPALKKIDPNTQTVVENGIAEDKFSQAAIPAVLTGLFKYSQSDEGAVDIINNGNEQNWVGKIFYDKREEVVSAISNYSEESEETIVAKMNRIADEAVAVAKTNTQHKNDVKEIKILFSNQVDNILLYLLPSLNIGQLLRDDTLDDNTHNMEGPISTLMHKLGSAFSTPVTQDEIKEQ